LQPKAAGQVFSFAESGLITSFFTSSNVGSSYSSKYFALNQVNHVSQLGTVFDQYRIDMVEFWIFPRVSDNTTITQPGVFVSVIDFDDANTPTSLGDLTDYTNALVTSGLDGHYRCFKPHAAVDLFNGAFSGYGNVASPWIDVASADVQHYAIKVGCSTTGTAQVYDARQRLHLSFRNVR